MNSPTSIGTHPRLDIPSPTLNLNLALRAEDQVRIAHVLFEAPRGTMLLLEYDHPGAPTRPPFTLALKVTSYEGKPLSLEPSQGVEEYCAAARENDISLRRIRRDNLPEHLPEGSHAFHNPMVTLWQRPFPQYSTGMQALRALHGCHAAVSLSFQNAPAVTHVGTVFASAERLELLRTDSTRAPLPSVRLKEDPDLRILTVEHIAVGREWKQALPCSDALASAQELRDLGLFGCLVAVTTQRGEKVVGDLLDLDDRGVPFAVVRTSKDPSRFPPTVRAIRVEDIKFVCSADPVPGKTKTRQELFRAQ